MGEGVGRVIEDGREVVEHGLGGGRAEGGEEEVDLRPDDLGQIRRPRPRVADEGGEEKVGGEEEGEGGEAGGEVREGEGEEGRVASEEGAEVFGAGRGEGGGEESRQGGKSGEEVGSDALVEEDGVLREQVGCVQGGRGRGEGMQIGFDPRLKVPKEEARGRIEEVQGRLFLGKGGDEIGVRVREATFHGRGAPAVVREELGDATQGVRQIDAREGGVE